jgi:hypothetical protein
VSRTEQGTYECDRCRADVGNGGVDQAAVIGDLDPDNPGMVRNLHICRDHPGPDGETVRGCVHRVLGPANLKGYIERTGGSSA